jgi:hypothetical protein
MHKMLCRLMAAAALAATPLIIAAPAAADPYKWCAVYGGSGGGGGTNCGFLTLEQCRATVSGIGGMCQPNVFYTGPDRGSAPSKRKRRPD